MKEEPIKFAAPEWPGWKLVNITTPPNNATKHKIVVDEKIINDVMEYGDMVAQVKEPLMESLMNIFVRIISGIIPGTEMKCAYILDFGDTGKVNLYMANDVWSSHALVTTDQPEKVDLIVDATKEYIRYRCFVDSIQPQ